MKYTLAYPMHPGFDPRLVDPSVVTAVAVEAEKAGFDAIAFTEHPAPSEKWLVSGGHESFDSLTALAFVAAATQRLRLMTYLLVLPYRNPLLAAKQAATVDRLSGGRLTLALGTGYLRSEFGALGVDFEERNDLFDEGVEVMKGIWSTRDYRFEGRHFVARGATQQPGPVQTPHIPLWVGGNSKASRRRVARFGQGWTPLLIDDVMSQTTRTPPLASPEALRSAIAELHELTEAEGRDPSGLDVQVEWTPVRTMTGDPAAALDAIGRLADAGATWVVAEPPEDDADKAIAAIQAYGENVIAPSRA